ncbi:hypothetical protein D5086_017394 [Populus alba]|uniref:Uncharacterized protein n=1 Tax=Populus alba TaxID=43335 RepID=A0ACC4BXA9_POPAL
MSTEATVAVEERVGGFECKRAKMASQLGPPGANSSSSPQVVYVSEDRSDAAVELPPRRQYLIRSLFCIADISPYLWLLYLVFGSASSSQVEVNCFAYLPPLVVLAIVSAYY